MKVITRDIIKTLFKKEKHLYIPESILEYHFSGLKYLSWIDNNSKDMFIIYEYKGELKGIRFDAAYVGSIPLARGFCEICNKQRARNEVALISAKTVKRPKNVDYRTRGTYICTDCLECNKNLKTSERINELFYNILERE